MNVEQLWTLFHQARELSGHGDFVIIGSLSVLGTEDAQAIPPDMALSIDIDCFTRADPGRVFDLQAALGEDSPFHGAHGYYLDPVSPHLPSLPEGWEGRMAKLERDGLRLWFLDPDDAAVSKYARGDPRDLRWIRAGIRAGLVSLPKVRARLRDTLFLDEEEARQAQARVAADIDWFEQIKRRR